MLIRDHAVYDNTAISKNPKDKAVSIDGANGGLSGNVLRAPNKVDDSCDRGPAIWPMLSRLANGASFHTYTGRRLVVREGPWKLFATFGKTISYKLFNVADDPQEKTELPPASTTSRSA